MSRRRAWLILLLLGLPALLVALALLAVTLRVEIANALLPTLLRARGLPETALRVERIDAEATRFADLSLGEERELSARSMTLIHRWADLRGRRLSAVVVTGLRLAVDLTGEGPPLGSLQGLLDEVRGGDGGEAPLSLASLVLQDSRLEAATPFGPFAAGVEASLGRSPAGEVEGRITFDQARLGETDLGALDIGLAGRGRSYALHAAFRRDREVGAAAGALSAEIDESQIALTLAEEARFVFPSAEAESLRTLGLPAILAAALAPGFELVLPLEVEHALTARLDLSAPTRAPDFAGTARIVARSGAEGDVAVQGRAELGPDGAPTHLEIAQLRVTASGLDLALGRLSNLELEGHLAGPPERLAGNGMMALGLETLASGPLALERLDLTLPFRALREERRLTLALGRGGRARARGLAYGEALSHEAPLELALSEGEAEIDLSPGEAPSFAGHLTLAGKPLALKLARAGGAPVTVELDPGQVVMSARATGGRAPELGATINRAEVVMPAAGLRLGALSGNLSQGSAGRRAEGRLNGRLTAEGSGMPLFVPLELSAEAERNDGRLDFRARGRDDRGRAIFTLEGAHSLASGRGRLDAALGPHRFAPGDLQPGNLAPPLALLREVNGELGATAELSWGGARLAGKGKLDLAGLDFILGEARIRGLSLALAFTDLLGPATPRSQRLAAARISLGGLVLAGPEARFQILSGAPPRLVLEGAEAGLLNGRLAVDGAVINPQAATNKAMLRLEALDLAAAFDLLGIEGLAGEGRISGHLPLAFAGRDLVITDGALAADGPGVLRFRSAAAAGVLAGGGEAVELMLKALEDFRYQELTLGIDKAAGAEPQLRLSLLGHNPEVLDGHPFRINVNLEGELGESLSAVSQAYGLAWGFLRRLGMGRR